MFAADDPAGDDGTGDNRCVRMNLVAPARRYQHALQRVTYGRNIIDKDLYAGGMGYRNDGSMSIILTKD